MQRDGVAERGLLHRVDAAGRRLPNRAGAHQRVLLRGRRELGLDALGGARRVLLGELVRDERPHVREVVADRHPRPEVAQRRVERLHRVGEAGEPRVRRRRARQVADRAQRAAQVVGELGRAFEHARAGGERAVDGGQARAQLARGSLDLV